MVPDHASDQQSRLRESTAYFLLPTAYCLLPTAYFIDRSLPRPLEHDIAEFERLAGL